MTAVVVKDWGVEAAARACLAGCLDLAEPDADDLLHAPLPWIVELSDETAAQLTRCLRSRAGATVSDAPVAVSI